MDPNILFVFNDPDREKAKTSGPSLGGVERTSPNTGWRRRLREGSSTNGGSEVHHFIYTWKLFVLYF